MSRIKAAVTASLAAGLLIAGIAAATTASANPGDVPITCTETTLVTAAPPSPQTINLGSTINVVFTAASSVTCSGIQGGIPVKFGPVDTTSLGHYKFTAVDGHGLSVPTASAGKTSATFALPVGVYTVTAKHIVWDAKCGDLPRDILTPKDRTILGELGALYCPADGSANYVVNATPPAPSPTPTVTVTTPGTTTVVTVPATPVKAAPSFTG